MHPCAHTVKEAATRPSTLPDVGTPASLVVMAVLGALILAMGLAAMLLSKR